jgi:hypothetical protein
MGFSLCRFVVSGGVAVQWRLRRGVGMPRELVATSSIGAAPNSDPGRQDSPFGHLDTVSVVAATSA